MKYRTLPLFVLNTILVFFAGCYSTEVSDSVNVNQAMIYQNFYIEYDAERNSAGARAVFRFESWQGNTLDLTDPSKLLINGETMRGEKEWLTGFVYRASNIRNNDNLYIFEFTDTENKVYTNKLKLNPIELDSLPPQLSKASEYEIFWQGAPVGHDESINLIIAVSDSISVSLSTGIQGANSIIIRTNDLSSLIPGHANLYINREIGTSLEQPTKVDGEIGGIYRGKVRHIRIVE